MSITILTGPPGHGKSYTSVKMIDEFVHDGKPVVTNVPLRADFAEQMARYHTPFGGLRKKAVASKIAMYQSRVHVCEDLTEITRVRFAGKGEGRGKVVIDEAHRHMNVRASRGSQTDEAQERKAVVAYASGHRHYGADLVLITQAIGNLDLQIRNLFEFHAEVRDMRKLPALGWLIRLIMPGGHLFIRKTTWSDKAKTRAGLTTYGLSKRLACLYDTHALEHVDWPDDAIILPHGSSPERRVNKTETATVDVKLTPGERRRLRKKEKRREERINAIPMTYPPTKYDVVNWISEVQELI